MPLTIGLVYDCKEDYLAAGFLPEDVLEFDPCLLYTSDAADE